MKSHSQEQLLPVDDNLSAFHHPFHMMDNDVNVAEGIAFHSYQISEGTRAELPTARRLGRLWDNIVVVRLKNVRT
jgi:hypothetical protein